MGRRSGRASSEIRRPDFAFLSPPSRPADLVHSYICLLACNDPPPLRLPPGSPKAETDIALPHISDQCCPLRTLARPESDPIVPWADLLSRSRFPGRCPSAGPLLSSTHPLSAPPLLACLPPQSSPLSVKATPPELFHRPPNPLQPCRLLFFRCRPRLASTRKWRRHTRAGCLPSGCYSMLRTPRPRASRTATDSASRGTRRNPCSAASTW